MTCCFIVPAAVLKRLSEDASLPDAARKSFADSAAFEAHWRALRELQSKSTALAATLSANVPRLLATAPAVTVYDCAKGTVLPGAPVASPGTELGPTAARAFAETQAVADFYWQVFGRSSVDGCGGTLQSSIQYGVGYNNAFWNGVQMIYGDGDGNIFLDFTVGRDVIAHELTHGVTQHTAQLAYTDEAGGLNESMSDVFGSMYRQWRMGQNVVEADWLIGRDIMGPGALAKGFTCLRDMGNPGAAHCLAPQATHYSQIEAGMDPHYTSGVASLAFHEAAMKVGGKSWVQVGRVWYRSLTGYGPSADLGMKAFAGRTREVAKLLFGDATVCAGIDAAWGEVGL
jgi:Zn-dependent metalloprotease